jgi:sodium/potassium-transporting ATPase subunit alpha
MGRETAVQRLRTFVAKRPPPPRVLAPPGADAPPPAAAAGAGTRRVLGDASDAALFR